MRAPCLSALLVLIWVRKVEGLSGGATFLLTALAYLVMPWATGTWLLAHEILQQTCEVGSLAATDR